MKKISKKELKDILEKHRMWLKGNDRGEKADLRFVDLRGADLQSADLEKVDLQYADLQYANLQYADLRCADLRYAELRGADLRGASLEKVDLQYADLRDADLRDADLRDADLQNINVNYRTAGIHPATEGELIGWGKKNGVIVKLLIPADARRSCATSRKHRAEYAKVLEVEGQASVAVKNIYGVTVYKPGTIVRCHKWDSNRWKECAGGIHFFLTREEAESY